MDIGGILRQSWQLAKHHRWLWWLGILAAATEGTSSSGGNIPTNFPGDSASTESVDLGQVPLGQWFSSWSPTHTLILVVAIVLFLLLWLGMTYLSYAAKAGLILSVDELETSQKELGFKRAFHQGRPFVWRLFGLSLLGTLIAILPLLVIGIPIGFGIVAASHVTSLLILLVVLALFCGLVWLIFSIYVGIVLKFAARHLVLKKLRIVAALREANQITRHNLGNAALVWGVNLGVGLALGLAFLLVMLLAGALAFGLGYFIYLPLKTTGAIVYGSIAGLAFLAAFFIWSGLYTAFSSGYWTLSYRALTYLATHRAAAR